MSKSLQTGELILYRTEDDQIEIQLRASSGTVWLTQKEISELFNTSKDNVSLHLKNIYKERELTEKATTEESSVVQKEGDRSIRRTLKLYNLDAILAVGYRVKSSRGVQFRQWATTVLKEYLIKGFVMDDERLKQSKKWDYFDEWLERIRDIRASEKRFYQKIKDLYATAIDYDKHSEQSQDFFKKVQNKMIWSVTGKTAAELIADRSDSKKQNMGLTSWLGSVVRKQDVGVSKNYLKKKEMEELNHIVTMYLDYAELQAKSRRVITMREWEEKLDAFLKFNERGLLSHAGQITAEVAKQLAENRYEVFNANRKTFSAKEADTEDIKELEKLFKKLESSKKEK